MWRAQLQTRRRVAGSDAVRSASRIGSATCSSTSCIRITSKDPSSIGYGKTSRSWTMSASVSAEMSSPTAPGCFFEPHPMSRIRPALDPQIELRGSVNAESRSRHSLTGGNTSRGAGPVRRGRGGAVRSPPALMTASGSEPLTCRPGLRRRIEKTTSIRVTDRLKKVPDAGDIRVVDGREVQVMHNGVVVEKDCYGGPWMTEVISRLHGHHEPQEEIAFAASSSGSRTALRAGDDRARFLSGPTTRCGASPRSPAPPWCWSSPTRSTSRWGVRNFELNGLRLRGGPQAAVGTKSRRICRHRLRERRDS